MWRPWRRRPAPRGDPRPGARSRRRAWRSRSLDRAPRRRHADGRLRVPVAAAARVGAVARRSCSSSCTRRRARHAVRALVAAAGRGRQAQLRPLPVALADLRARSSATHGSVGRFLVAASLITVVVTELSYRYVETPVRQGAPAALVARTPAPARSPWSCSSRRASCMLARRLLRRGAARSIRPPAAPTPTFEAPTTVAHLLPYRRRAPVRRRSRPAAGRRPTDAAARRPRRGHRRRLAGPLAGGQPAGRHRVDVPDHGRLDRRLQRLRRRTGASARAHGVPQLLRRSARAGSTSGRRAVTTADASVALVVLGAWDVFDLRDRRRHGPDVRHAGVGRVRPRAACSEGIDALVGGRCAKVALLEVRVHATDLASRAPAVPALPERADDAARRPRQRAVARPWPPRTRRRRRSSTGPTRGAATRRSPTDVGMRWDGVHVYKPGAKPDLRDDRPRPPGAPEARFRHGEGG